MKPDWSKALEHHRYLAIDADGSGFYYVHKPRPVTADAMWQGHYEETGYFAGDFEIPLGTDWRLCVWEREEANK
jgi:hypothetical protein